jgi:hypothetical protein
VSERKPAWPLLTLAVLSFVPGFGFFLGSIAVSWGLLSERPRAKLAVGIGAAGALVHLVAFGVFLATSNQRSPLFQRAFAEMTRQDLGGLVLALEAYHRRESAYPPTLLELQRKLGLRRPVNILDHSGGLSLDAAPYRYRLAADGASYDLFAVGPDGRPDTADDIRPVLPDSLQQSSGFRPPP